MTKIFGIIMICLLAILAACSNETPQSGLKSGPLAKAVKDEKAEREGAIRKELTNLLSGKGTILSAAQESEVCDWYYKYQHLRNLEESYKRLGISSSLGGDLQVALNSHGQRAGAAAYEKMKSGKPTGCSGELTETYLIEQFADIMDVYGSPDGVKYDPKVIRTAYLRATKEEIGKLLADFKKRPQSGDVLGALAHAVETAKTNWNFSAAELGVPPEVAKQLKN